MKCTATLALVAVTMSWGCSSKPSMQESPRRVSIIGLVSTPEAFSGRKVVTLGVLRLEREANVLYLHQEDFENRLEVNAVFLDLDDISGETRPDWLKLRGKHVVLTGNFDATRRGRGRAYAGTIQVESIEARELP